MEQVGAVVAEGGAAHVNPKIRKWLAVAALVLAATLVIQKLRAHQPVSVALQFDLYSMEWTIPAPSPQAPPAERLTADKLRRMQFEVRDNGELAAKGTLGVGTSGAPTTVTTAEMALRRGDYALAVIAEFQRYDGSPYRTQRIYALHVEEDGAQRVALRDVPSSVGAK